MIRPRGGGWEPARVPSRRLSREVSLAWEPEGRVAWAPAAGDPSLEAGDPGTAAFWRVIRRRRGTIALVCLAAMLVTAIWVLLMRPVYTATATVRIEKDEPRVLTFDEVVKQTDPLPDSLQTQQRLLQSRTLAHRVIKQLRLTEHPDFQDSPPSWPALESARVWMREHLAPWRPSTPGRPAQLEAGLAVESPVTRQFASSLTVEAVRGSRLVKVSFESHDPALAARVANALSDTFVVQTLELKSSTGRYASGFLARQMGEARGRLETAEEKLNAFLKAHGINFVGPATVLGKGGTGSAPERQDLVTQQLASVSDALLKARTERIAKESLLQQTRGKDTDSLASVLQSPHIVKLKGDLGAVEAQYKELAQTFKADYPRMRQLQQTIGELKEQVRAEIDRTVKAIEADFRSASQSERELQRAMDAQRAEALKLGDNLVQYNILRRDVDAGRELYTALLTRLKETQISADLLTSPISIVDHAEVPLQPSRPRKTLAVTLAGSLGLLGGVALAFLLERTDKRVRSVDVREQLGVPRLGMVPDVHALGRWYARPTLSSAGWNGHRMGSNLGPQLDAAQIFAESFRELRTNVLYSSPGRTPRSMVVTSLDAGDGKTVVAMNLAVALAELGSGEVVLIDGNLRHPDLHDLLGVSRSPGLSALLEGEAELSAVVKPTEVPNLSVIPGGRRPGNAAELLGSRRMADALDTLAARFTHIVVDAPPLGGVSDALHLAPRLDGVLLVLRHDRANQEDAQEALERLWLVHANVFGIVVNGVDGPGIGRRRAYYPVGRTGDDGDEDA